MSQPTAEIKACCASAYSSGAARWLLGESFHPGGAVLTAELVRSLSVGPGSLVLDMACGPGASAIQLAAETGAEAVGVDLSGELLERARVAAVAAGLEGRVRFLEGDAEALPVADASVDGVLCECALCTFPHKAAAASEMARVLRPGGRLALSDMTAYPGRLPAQLRTHEGWVACIAGARPLEELSALLEDAGFRVDFSRMAERALEQLVDSVEARLRVARMLECPVPGELRADADRGLELAAAAREAIADGALGYGLVAAVRLREP